MQIRDVLHDDILNDLMTRRCCPLYLHILSSITTNNRLVCNKFLAQLPTLFAPRRPAHLQVLCEGVRTSLVSFLVL